MIRPAARSDLPLLPEIERSAGELFRGTHMDFAAEGEVNTLETLQLAHKRGLIWVAEADGRPAGFIFGEPTVSGLYLREMAVASWAQRRGLGGRLLETASAAARPRGLKQVWLTTDRTLAWNAPFYARHGFRIAEDDAVPRDLRLRLQGQVDAGFDPAARCAMVRAA